MKDVTLLVYKNGKKVGKLNTKPKKPKGDKKKP